MYKHILCAVFLMFSAITSFSCRGDNNSSTTVPTPGIPLPPPSAGKLDTSFGTGGKVTVLDNSYFEDAVSTLLQADGKIIIVVQSKSTTTVGNANFMNRYTVDGLPDVTFGTNSRVTMETINYISSAIIQPDGKVIAVGSSVVRFNSDGTLDATFGTEGKVVTTGQDGCSTGAASAAAFQKDGKIIVVGSSYTSSTG